MLTVAKVIKKINMFKSIRGRKISFTSIVKVWGWKQDTKELHKVSNSTTNFEIQI